MELQEEEAAALVKEYNKEGNDAGYESKFQYSKRPRMDESGRGGDRDRYDRGDRGDRPRGGFSPRGYGMLKIEVRYCSVRTNSLIGQGATR